MTVVPNLGLKLNKQLYNCKNNNIS